jgi:hypothetical protein
LRERNDGKNTTVVATGKVDLATSQIQVGAVARDGSFGPASARAHRLGGFARWAHARASVGVEALRVWGLRERGEDVGIAMAAWTVARPSEQVSVAAGLDAFRYDGGGRRGQSYLAVGGAHAGEHAKAALWLRLTRTWSTGVSDPLPGANADDAWVISIVASARRDWRW